MGGPLLKLLEFHLEFVLTKSNLIQIGYIELRTNVDWSCLIRGCEERDHYLVGYKYGLSNYC